MHFSEGMARKSVIDEELTPIERSVLGAYRSPAAGDMRRQVHLSVQYAIGAGLFVYVGLSTGQPAYCVVVYVVFLLWMAARLRGASRVAGTMPAIIEKYETHVEALRSEVARLGAMVGEQTIEPGSNRLGLAHPGPQPPLTRDDERQPFDKA